MAALAFTAAFTALAPAAAEATTFCVPTFHAACPNSGGNVAQADLEAALQTSGDDTVPDRIVIDAVTVASSPDSYELDSGDNDDLEIVGAGPDKTTITNTGSGNEFMMNLNGARDVTMRDLTLEVPAAYPDNQGGALQAEKGLFENVDIRSLNVRGDGINSAIGGSVFLDGRVYGASGGSIDVAFGTNGAESGELRVERTVIEDSSWAIHVDDPEVATRVRRTRIIDPLAYGLRVSDGGFLVFENGLITVDDGWAVNAVTGNGDHTLLTVRHATIDDTNGGALDPIVFVGDGAATPGSINTVISDTILAGNEDPVECKSPISSSSLTLRYSWFFHSVTVEGNCTISNPQTLDAFAANPGPPVFVDTVDYRLPAGSPAIDRGDPLTVTLPTVDLFGAPRPWDGDGDGDARRDIGAHEYGAPVPEEPTTPEDGGAQGPSGPTGPTGPGSDTTPPQTFILSGPGKRLAEGRATFVYGHDRREPAAFTCKLDGRRAVGCGPLRNIKCLLRKPPKCAWPRRVYTGLRSGRHVFRVWATDAAGNKDPTPAKRRFRVPGP